MNYSLKGEIFYPTPRLANLTKKYSKGVSLDVGCGTGEYFQFFKSKKLYGVDLTLSYLKKIKKNKYKGREIILKQGDVRKLPFKDETFDYILCSAVLEYMKNSKELSLAVSEMKRVLKPEGVLVVSSPHKNAFTSFVREKIIGFFLKQKATDPYFVMGKSYTYADLKKYNFKLHGGLGWVTWKNLDNEFLSKVIDSVFWYLPIFSGTLIGIYEKK